MEGHMTSSLRGAKGLGLVLLVIAVAAVALSASLAPRTVPQTADDASAAPSGQDSVPSGSPTSAGRPGTPRPAGSTDSPLAPDPSDHPSPTAAPDGPAASDPLPQEPAADVGPSDELRLRRVTTISGSLSPKSVVASQTGLFFAQNMMYRHTISVFDRDQELVKTIRDSVDLAEYGFGDESRVVRGAPVEAAFTPDRSHVYVSQYSMYGSGFDNPGEDTCYPAEGRDDSFVYRIDVASLSIDQVLKVGATPKYLAVSPDGRVLVVANWCSYSVSIIETATGRELQRIPMGPYPRGITFDPASTTAYVALMGGTEIDKIDLATYRVRRIRDVGVQPRHLVMSPDGRYLYASLDEGGGVIKIDTATDQTVDRVQTGVNPRSMDIAPDGRSLYVVNYESGTASKIRTEDMTVIQDVHTAYHPIGITYDAVSRQLWVACYSGIIVVFEDRPPR